jgi:hypothetical protein
MIGFDLAALVDRDPGLVEAQPVGVGTTTDRHEHDIGLDRLGIAAGGGFERQDAFLPLTATPW